MLRSVSTGTVSLFVLFIAINYCGFLKGFALNKIGLKLGFSRGLNSLFSLLNGLFVIIFFGSKLSLIFESVEIG